MASIAVLSATMNLVHEPEESRFAAYVDDELAGLIDYRLRHGSYLLMHTEVPEVFEGKGIGSALVKFAFQEIAAEEVKLVPICPFIRSYLKRHPEHGALVDEELWDRYRHRLEAESSDG